MSRQKMKGREQKTAATPFILCRDIYNLCRNIKQGLKTRSFFVIKKFMSRHVSRAAKNDKFVVIKFLCHNTQHSCHNNH